MIPEAKGKDRRSINFEVNPVPSMGNLLGKSGKRIHNEGISEKEKSNLENKLAMKKNEIIRALDM